MQLVEMFRGFQGESIYQGRNSLFIRFPFCNLRCVQCDSKYTWNATETTEYSLEQITEEVVKSSNIIFTGGEPLLPINLKNLVEIIDNDYKKNFQNFEIETNGILTIPDEYLARFSWLNITFNISPKMNFLQEKLRVVDSLYPKLIDQLRAHNCNIKFNVKYLLDNEKDIIFIEDQMHYFKLEPSMIYVQPVGTMGEEIREKTLKYSDEILKRGWNLSSRLHCLIWNNKRGV